MTISRLGKTEAAVFFRDLDAVRAEFHQAALHLVGDFAGAVDEVGVDMLPQISGQLGKKLVRVGLFLRVDIRDGVAFFRRPPAHEKIRDETYLLRRLSPRL